MSMIAVCDGCGKQEPALGNNSQWLKPNLWYQRTPLDDRKPILACSRECIQIVEDKRAAEGKKRNDIVMPF